MWYVVYGVWYMVYGIWYMVYGIWCILVYGVWCMVDGRFLDPRLTCKAYSFYPCPWRWADTWQMSSMLGLLLLAAVLLESNPIPPFYIITPEPF